MGLSQSKIAKRIGVNYDCKMCRLTKRTPNIIGKYIMINDTIYQCNSCEYIFKREYCPRCEKPFKIPNLAGSFYIKNSGNDCSCK